VSGGGAIEAGTLSGLTLYRRATSRTVKPVAGAGVSSPVWGSARIAHPLTVGVGSLVVLSDLLRNPDQPAEQVHFAQGDGEAAAQLARRGDQGRGWGRRVRHGSRPLSRWL